MKKEIEKGKFDTEKTSEDIHIIRPPEWNSLNSQLMLTVNEDRQLEYLTEEEFREQLFEKNRLFKIGERDREGIEVIAGGKVYNVLSYLVL